MDSQEFRQRGREMVDYVADYLDNISDRRVTPNIEPGYLRPLLPDAAPQQGENWDDIMSDIENKIMPGVTHWQHPRFHAYFPSGNSYPSILGDMLSDAIGCIGFSWAASPACTELETIVLDWLGKMVGLPETFLSFSENSKGGGVIQSSASECVFVSLLAARAHKIRELKLQNPSVDEGVLLSKLIAYCSKEAHSCAEKAAMMAFTKLRILEPDENHSLRGCTLREQMAQDKENGLIPFYVETTLGTTSCCSFDNLAEIGPICEEFNVWLHVDGAYGGNSFICPELREPMTGIEFASSFNFNPNKFMLTNFDCSVMWVRDRFRLTQALVVDPLYLQHNYSEQSIDYRHWGIPLSRRFRALKLWFVIRSYGVEGLQQYIREHCRLAKLFESMVLKDERFEVASPVKLGLVCFRLNGSNSLNQKLLSSINASGRLHMVPASLGEKYVIRFCVCAQNATDADIEHAWNVISEFATGIKDALAQEAIEKNIKKKDEEEQSSKSEEESNEEVFQMDRKNKRSLRYKRSFFVRMVSDPKIYNPKIVRSLSGSQKSRRSTTTDSEENNSSQTDIICDPYEVLHSFDRPAESQQETKIESDDIVATQHQKMSKTLSDLSERVSVCTLLDKEGGQPQQRNGELSKFRNWNTRLTLKNSPHRLDSKDKIPEEERRKSPSPARSPVRPPLPVRGEMPVCQRNGKLSVEQTEVMDRSNGQK